MAGKGLAEGSVYQRPDGRWCGQYWAVLGNGERKRMTVYAATKREVITKMRHQSTDVSAVDSSMTLDEHFKNWIEHVEGRCRPKTIDHYRTIMEGRVLPFLGKVKLKDITVKKVEDFFLKLSKTESAKGTVYTARGVNMARQELRNCLNVAVRWGLITSNPVMRSVPMKEPRKQLGTLDTVVYSQLVDCLCSDDQLRVLGIALLAGMRFGEALGLTKSSIDLTKRRITLNHQLQQNGREFSLVPVKSDESNRIIPMSDKLLGQIEIVLGQISGRELTNTWVDDLLFLSSNLTPLRQNNIRRAFNARLKATGLPSMRVHDLRHAWASVMVQEGVSIKAVQMMLGHSKSQLTLDTYAHLAPNNLHDSMATIDRITRS
jgi:integrase